MFEGAYPPGVTGKMIDDYFHDRDLDRCCENCENYFNGTCNLADRGLSAEEIDAMSDDEYTELVERQPDDSCDDHEWREE